jgi:hypothetical protein
MRPVILKFLVLAALCLASGCAPRWSLSSGRCRTAAYQLQPPAKWMIIKKGTTTVLSRHGPNLEAMVIERRKAGEPFYGTTLTCDPSMLPHEIGELILMRKTALSGVLDVALKEESVAMIDGRKAVRVVVEYLQEGIPFTDVVYAFVDVDGFYYELRYFAVTRHYFAEYLDDFERMVAGFRVR